MRTKKSAKSKLIIESRIGTLFTMTVGEWKEELNEYKVKGKAYIPLTEIVGMSQTTLRGRLVSKVKLKTQVGLGINGIRTFFEIPLDEWNELFNYITSTDKEENK